MHVLSFPQALRLAIIISAFIVSVDSVAVPDDKPESRLSLVPTRTINFSTNEATWMSLDVSPNGKTIVFDLLGDLYTMAITGGKASAVSTGMAFDAQPRWSPDGSRIVFVSDRNGSQNLWLLDVGKTIDDHTKASDGTGLTAVTSGSQQTYMSPEWTPDGDYIVSSKAPWLGMYHPWLHHVDGGVGIDLFQSDVLSGKEAAGAAIGPDERYIYMAVKDGPWEYDMRKFGFRIAAFDRDKGELQYVAGEVGGAVRPAISPDGQWMVYATRLDGKTAYRLRNLATESDHLLAYPVQRDDQESSFTRDMMPGYSFTPDSLSIIATIDGRLFRIDVADGRQTEIPFLVDVNLNLGPLLDFEVRVDDGPVQVRQIRWPSLSPDGSKLLFEAMHRIYVRDMRNGRVTLLVQDEMPQYAPVWSPDGKSVAFVSWRTNSGGGLYQVSATGGKARKSSRFNAFYANPVYTPDGHSILVERLPLRQHQGLNYLNPVEAKDKSLVRVTIQGSVEQVIMPLKGVNVHFADRKDRFYVHEGAEGLASYRMDGTDRKVHLKVTGLPSVTLKQPPASADAITMSPDGKHASVLIHNRIYRLAVPRVGNEPPTVSVMDIAAAPVPVEQITTAQGAVNMAWADKGKTMIWSLGSSVFLHDFADSAAPAAAEIRIPISLSRFKGEGILVLRNARVLTMAGDDDAGIIENGTVVIEANRIVQVGPSDRITAPKGAKVIDLGGMTLLPGFVDTHAHMWPAWGIHQDMVWQYLASLAYGVTTTRDPQTGSTDVLTYSDLVEVGEIVGPRIFHTGPGVTSGERISSQHEADEVISRYADYFKTPYLKEYVAGDRYVTQWIIQAARKYRLRPTIEGAADMKRGLTQIMDGYSGHEHSFPISPLYRDVVEFVARSGTTYTPTLLATYGGPWAENYYYATTNVHDDEKLRRFIPHRELDKLSLRRVWFSESEYVFKSQAGQAKKIVDAGGNVSVGSHGQLQGLGYHWEMWSLAAGGMNNTQVLRAATVSGARALGMQKDLGSIEVGKLADMLIFRSNPLDNIRNTTDLALVVKNGLMYDADTLDLLWPINKKQPVSYWHTRQ